MATIQSKITNGHKYWYIVESRRVNGKPRPIVLEYLGKASDLLARLKSPYESIKLKSYSHGCIVNLINIAKKINLCNIINKHIEAHRDYMSKQPIRNNLTPGGTYLLAALGRVCMPTSKDSWLSWADTTSLSYLLRMSFKKLDSSHFWDLMDALPAKNISRIESELTKKVLDLYDIKTDNLFYDTTNFYTYIDTANEKCTIAKRGKNKQKRSDLRQIGMAMVVTKDYRIPLLHVPYEGNMHDSKVFTEVSSHIKDRLDDLGLSIDNHTIVFDRGNNSKKNFKLLKELELHYVAALSPCHHKEIINKALEHQGIYRSKEEIWDDTRTVIITVSDKLKAGQIRGLYTALQKMETKLTKIQVSLSSPKKKNKKLLEARIEKAVNNNKTISGFIETRLEELEEKKYRFIYSIDCEKLRKFEEGLGLRMLITDRHDWSTPQIIEAYNGQSHIEKSFKLLKNNHYLSLRPQYHWTDQKIKVHFLICMIAYLLSSISYMESQKILKFTMDLPNYIRELNNIRLGTILDTVNNRGATKAFYKIEEMTPLQKELFEATNIEDDHKKIVKIPGLRVYN